MTVAVAYSSVCIATDITGQVRGQGPGGGSRLSLPGRLWMVGGDTHLIGACNLGRGREDGVKNIKTQKTLETCSHDRLLRGTTRNNVEVRIETKTFG